MHFEISSAICFNFDQSKILSSGNGLNDIESGFIDRWAAKSAKQDQAASMCRLI